LSRLSLAAIATSFALFAADLSSAAGLRHAGLLSNFERGRVTSLNDRVQTAKRNIANPFEILIRQILRTSVFKKTVDEQIVSVPMDFDCALSQSDP
jgi:hypothetical protein